jgi:hypothetical protein
MFVLCVLYSKGQKAKPGQSGQRSADKVQRKKGLMLGPIKRPIEWVKYLFSRGEQTGA